MSWKESTAVEQRKEFIQEYLAGNADRFKALCHKYGISEKTGYPYRYYTCIQYNPETMSDEDNYIKPKRRQNGNKIKPNDKPKPG